MILIIIIRTQCGQHILINKTVLIFEGTRMTNTFNCKVKKTSHCRSVTRPDCKQITWNECRYVVMMIEA